MKNDEIFDALCGIDQKFIDTANDTDRIRSIIQKEKRHRTRLISSICTASAAAGLALFFVVNNSTKNAPPLGEHVTVITATDALSVTDAPPTAPTYAQTTTVIPHQTEPPSSPETTECPEASSIPETDAEETTDLTPDDTDAPTPDNSTSKAHSDNNDQPAKGKPDSDGITEELDPFDELTGDSVIINGTVYRECQCDANAFSIGEFLGNIGDFQTIGMYGESYVMPFSAEDEVYLAEYDSGHIMVKTVSGDLRIFEKA